MKKHTKKIKLKKDGTPDKRCFTKEPRKKFLFTPEELLEKFIEYSQLEGFQTKRKSRSTETLESSSNTLEEDVRYMPLSIVGFTLFLKVNSKYLYRLPEEYSDVLDTINARIEDHFVKGVAIGDINSTWGIFYSKNKFGYRDVKQIEADVKSEVTNKVELSDKELMDILDD